MARNSPLSAQQRQMLHEIATHLAEVAAYHGADRALEIGLKPPAGKTRSEQASRCRTLTRLQARGLIERLYEQRWEFGGRLYHVPGMYYAAAVRLTPAGLAYIESETVNKKHEK